MNEDSLSLYRPLILSFWLAAAMLFCFRDWRWIAVIIGVSELTMSKGTGLGIGWKARMSVIRAFDA